MVKINFFNSIMEAELAGNLLGEHRIKNFIKRKGTLFSGYTGDSCGAELFVAEKDIEKAIEILGIDSK